MPKGFSAIFGVLLISLSGCSSDGETDASDTGLQIVVTTSVIGDIVFGVVGDSADLDVLIPPGADPHEFEPSAQDVVAITEADLVVVNGLGLEAGLQDVLASAEADGATILVLGPGVDPIGFGGSECVPDADSGSPCDPHFWMDPIRVGESAGLVAEKMGELDDSVDWRSSALAYQQEMESADRDVVATLQDIPAEDRLLVTNHDSFGYFARRYGFTVVGTVVPGGSTLADPSSEDLAGLVGVILETGTKAIFVETTESIALAEAVAAEAGQDVLIVELFTGPVAGAEAGAETLARMFVTNAERIAGGLQ